MDKVAIYLRLSMEDKDDRDESNSIGSQRTLLFDYISHHEELRGKEIAEFCDDGHSGTSMERPGMQRLLNEIRGGKIGCVLVKDMSRFSRDYIELGTYMNQIFPFLGVRFIAVNDHYDSRDHAGSTPPVDTAFQTLLYDLYSKDISVKVKTSVENKCANGEYVFGQVPFGYEKSREVKNAVVVNEQEARIVRRIFALALCGNSSTQIARILNEKGIPTKTQVRHPEREEKGGRRQAWDSASVRAVLNNRFYLGEMAYGKSKRKYVGSKGGIAVPMEDWKVIPDHHEALVAQEVYEKVCRFRKDADTARKGEKNPLVGKLFCGGCGYSMTYRPVRHRRFECPKHAVLQIPECCTYIPAEQLEEAVLTLLIQELMVRGNAEEESKSLLLFQKTCIARLEKRAAASQDRQKRLLEEAASLYEKYALGLVQAISYRQRADCIREQVCALSVKEQQDRNEQKRLQEECRRAEEDMKQVIQYARLESLTQDVVDTFVSKIYVYRGKRIEIEWNFCGNGEELRGGV